MDLLAGLAQGFAVVLTPSVLAYCLFGSLIGTLIGVLPGIGPLAALALLMSEGSTLRNLVMLAFGLLLASVGMDPVSGMERFTFGSVNLMGGFELVAVIIGLFGLSEILLNVETTLRNEIVTRRVRDIWPTRRDLADAWRPTLRGSGLGFVFGVLPGGGPVTASFLSYVLERKVSRTPERFGKGAIEGVAGPESANNAAVASSMIPLLSLGLPGNAVTALLMGALVIQGVQPGPALITQRPDVFWGVIASMYVGNVFLLILNLPLIGLWVQLLRIPYSVLFPLILLLATVGSYSANKNFFDLWVMLGFGVLGWVLRKGGYELAPLVLALVLAPMMEQSLRQSMMMSTGGAAILVDRPVSLGLLAAAAALVLLILKRHLNHKETRHVLS